MVKDTRTALGIYNEAFENFQKNVLKECPTYLIIRWIKQKWWSKHMNAFDRAVLNEIARRLEEK